MTETRILAVGIDPSGAKDGAAIVVRHIDEIRAAAGKLHQQLSVIEKSFAKLGGISAFANGFTSLQKSIQNISSELVAVSSHVSRLNVEIEKIKQSASMSLGNAQGQFGKFKGAANDAAVSFEQLGRKVTEAIEGKLQPALELANNNVGFLVTAFLGLKAITGALGLVKAANDVRKFFDNFIFGQKQVTAATQTIQVFANNLNAVDNRVLTVNRNISANLTGLVDQSHGKMVQVTAQANQAITQTVATTQKSIGGLAAAFRTFGRTMALSLGPVSLLLTLFPSALDAFGHFDNATGEAADELLRFKGAGGEALEGLKKLEEQAGTTGDKFRQMSAEMQQTLVLDMQTRILELQGIIQAAAEKLEDHVPKSLFPGLSDFSTAQIINQQFFKLIDQFKAAKIGATEFQTELLKLAENGEHIQPLVAKMVRTARSTETARNEVSRLETVLAQLQAILKESRGNIDGLTDSMKKNEAATRNAAQAVDEFGSLGRGKVFVQPDKPKPPSRPSGFDPLASARRQYEESLRTPLEKFEAEMAKLDRINDRFWSKSAEGAEFYRRAVEAARAELVKGVAAQEKGLSLAALRRKAEDESLEKLKAAEKGRADLLDRQKVGLDEKIARQKLELQLAGDTTYQLDAQLMLQDLIAQHKEKGLPLDEQGLEILRQKVELWRQGKVALDEQNKKIAEQDRLQKEAAGRYTEIWNNAIRDIQGLITDTFSEFLDGNLKSAKDYWKAFVNIGKRALANLASAVVTNLFSGKGFNLAALFGGGGQGQPGQPGSFDLGFGDILKWGEKIYDFFTGNGFGGQIIDGITEGFSSIADGISGGFDFSDVRCCRCNGTAPCWP